MAYPGYTSRFGDAELADLGRQGLHNRCVIGILRDRPETLLQKIRQTLRGRAESRLARFALGPLHFLIRLITVA